MCMLSISLGPYRKEKLDPKSNRTASTFLVMVFFMKPLFPFEQLTRLVLSFILIMTLRAIPL